MKLKENLLFVTTIFALIATIVYSVLIFLLYKPYLDTINIVIFYVVVWALYYFITRHRKS